MWKFSHPEHWISLEKYSIVCYFRLSYLSDCCIFVGALSFRKFSYLLSSYAIVNRHKLIFFQVKIKKKQSIKALISHSLRISLCKFKIEPQTPLFVN